MTQCVTPYSIKKLQPWTIFACEISDIKQKAVGFVKNVAVWSILLTVFFPFSQTVLSIPTVQAFFSPGGKITTELIKRISGSKKSIFAAVYTFTDVTVAQALVEAQKRGVEVKIVIDRSTIESQWGKVKILIDGGVGVFCKLTERPALGQKGFASDQEPAGSQELDLAAVCQPRAFHSFAPIMHHKYAIFDQEFVWTGSFNWTLSANNKNSENVVFIGGVPELVVDFTKNFQVLLGVSKKIDLEAYNALVTAYKSHKEFLQEQRFYQGPCLSVSAAGKKIGRPKVLVASTKRAAKQRLNKMAKIPAFKEKRQPTIFA